MSNQKKLARKKGIKTSNIRETGNRVLEDGSHPI